MCHSTLLLSYLHSVPPRSIVALSIKLAILHQLFASASFLNLRTRQVEQAKRFETMVTYRTKQRIWRFFCKYVLLVYFAAHVDLKQKDHLFCHHLILGILFVQENSYDKIICGSCGSYHYHQRLLVRAHCRILIEFHRRSKCIHKGNQ